MNAMKIISVNVGQPTALQVGQRTAVSGIRKHPVPGRVQVGEKGLEGDHVLNRRYHGGPDQAVYVYTREDYDHWTELLGRALEPGAFGENVLISGAESAEVRVGERFLLGAVEIEVTAPAFLAAPSAPGWKTPASSSASRPPVAPVSTPASSKAATSDAATR